MIAYESVWVHTCACVLERDDRLQMGCLSLGGMSGTESWECSVIMVWGWRVRSKLSKQQIHTTTTHRDRDLSHALTLLHKLYKKMQRFVYVSQIEVWYSTRTLQHVTSKEDILKNVLFRHGVFCVPQKKVNHTGLEQHDGANDDRIITFGWTIPLICIIRVYKRFKSSHLVPNHLWTLQPLQSNLPDTEREHKTQLMLLHVYSCWFYLIIVLSIA